MGSEMCIRDRSATARVGRALGSRREPATLVVRETKSATAELLAQHAILLAQIVDCLLLLLIHPARDGNQHEPKRVENAHCSTVSWALCIVFNAFDFLDNTREPTIPIISATIMLEWIITRAPCQRIPTRGGAEFRSPR